MTDEELAPFVAMCVRYVLERAPNRGVKHSDFVHALKGYRTIVRDADRFRLQILLCKRSELAVIANGETLHFYARDSAPPGAFNIEDAKRTRHSEAIGRAMRWA